MAKDLTKSSAGQRVLLALLLLASVTLAWSATALPLFSSAITPNLQEGQVADRDYRAPERISYVSQVLTEQRRDAAARGISPFYTSPDARVARKQLESLRTVLAYISDVRADAYATPSQKLSDLSAMDDFQLNQSTALTILGMTDTRWQATQQETIVVLEKVMSNAIRPEGVADARNRVPALVSLTLPEEQAGVVAELAAAFVAPNSFYSEDLTLAAQDQARAAVEPVTRSFVAGQTIVFRGEVLDSADTEALAELGFIQPGQIWPDLASISILVLVMTVYIVLYFRRERVDKERNRRAIPLVALLFIVFLFGARLIIPSHTVLPYALPIAAYSLTVAALYGSNMALVSTLPLSILIAYGLPNALELTLFYLLGGLFGVLAVGRARRMASFFWAGVAVAFSSTGTVLVFRLTLPTTDAIGMVSLIGASLINGLATASATIVLQYALAQFLGMTTPMQLVDLTRPDHPLLQLLLQQAPGTYQHSLQVANLAEQAAERIGADPLLTRVGTLYHDVGKTQNSAYFIENQVSGLMNPHERLDPYQSAETIIRHVHDGLELARKYRLPGPILNFIKEHHGTLTTRYQYARAVSEAGGDESQVDMLRFQYPGPIPQSRETAILMLADGCEARVRAERPVDEDELRKVIGSLIDDRFANDQFANTDLTFRDLTTIQESFVSSLRVIYHPRVKYPSLEPQVPLDKAISADTVPLKAFRGSQPAPVTGTGANSITEANLPVDATR